MFLQIKVLNDVAGLGGLGNFSNVDLEKVLAGKKSQYQYCRKRPERRNERKLLT